MRSSAGSERNFSQSRATVLSVRRRGDVFLFARVVSVLGRSSRQPRPDQECSSFTLPTLERRT